MSVNILIPTALRNYAGGSDAVAVEASTVGGALDALMTTYPDLKKHLYNDEGALRHFVNIYVNDEDIRYAEKHATPLKDGDSVSIVPSIAGGVAVIEEAAASGVELDHDEILRYSRHLIMPEVALEGQKKLKAAKVLCIGAGGLGSPLALYLGAAGVGKLGIVDFDVVDFTNLQRQIIHSTSNVGRSKLDSARERIAEINPYVNVVPHEVALTSENAMELFADYDIVVDGTDNFPTRYLVNDACVLMGKPNVYGSIFRFEGQATVFYAKEGPCYRCLYPEPPPPGLVPSCAEGGVLGVLPGIIGAIQANEAIKIILGAPDIMVNRLLLFDAWRMRFRELKLRKNPDCPVCGEHPTIKHLIDYEQFCGITTQAETKTTMDEITATELKQRLDKGDDIQIIDVREPHEYEIGQIPDSKLIPLGQVLNRMNEIDPDRETVVHCKMGGRSAKAIDALTRSGFPGKLINLKGGITAWSDEVDPRVPKY